MLKPIISRSRSDIQLLYHSRILTRKGGVLLNSLPKSGTHFFKAVMQGMGYEFLGQIGSRSVVRIRLHQGSKRFFTAHTRTPMPGEGIKLLCVRDPAAVALSLVHYAKSRKDHYRNAVFENTTIADAMIAVFKGSDQFKPLGDRYEAMLHWAERSDATTLDFDDVRSNPEIMAHVFSQGAFDGATVSSELNKWNPTKRDSDKTAEKAFLEEFRQEHDLLLRPSYDVYERMKALRAYDL